MTIHIKETFSFDRLPPEVISMILHYSSDVDVHHFRQTNHYHRAVVDNDLTLMYTQKVMSLELEQALKKAKDPLKTLIEHPKAVRMSKSPILVKAEKVTTEALKENDASLAEHNLTYGLRGDVSHLQLHGIQQLVHLSFTRKGPFLQRGEFASLPTHLSSLQMTSCALKRCPDLRHLNALHHLDLSSNAIGRRTILDARRFPASLCTLNLAKNDLYKLAHLGHLADLQHFDVHSNPDLLLPEVDFRGLQKLRYINFSETFIHEDDPGADGETLYDLDKFLLPHSLEIIVCNLLDCFWALGDLSTFTSLKRLETVGTHFSQEASFTLPISLQQLIGASVSPENNLEELVNLVELDTEVWAPGWYEHEYVNFPPNLQSLRVFGLGKYDAVFSIIRGIDNLVHLDLGGNHFAALLHSAFPPKLYSLNLSDNALTSLADAKFPATLQSLDLSKNHLVEVADVLPAQLKTLDLSRNKLDRLDCTTLPVGLTTLFAGHNQIRTIHQMERLVGLQRCSLEMNHLQNLKGVVLPAKLTRLRL